MGSTVACASISPARNCYVQAAKECWLCFVFVRWFAAVVLSTTFFSYRSLFLKLSSVPVCCDTVVKGGKECGTNWGWKSLRFPGFLSDLYIRCNILYYLGRSFGNWCSSVTVVTRQPEGLFTISGWDGDLCICHRVQPFSMVHPPSYGTGSGSSFSGVLPPSNGMVTGSSLSEVHPLSFGWILEALCLRSIHPPLDGTGSSLSEVHPPSFGWTLGALWLGSIHPPLDGHWKLSVWGPFALLWMGTGSSLWAKRMGREADHSCSTIAEV